MTATRGPGVKVCQHTAHLDTQGIARPSDGQMQTGHHEFSVGAFVGQNKGKDFRVQEQLTLQSVQQDLLGYAASGDSLCRWDRKDLHMCSLSAKQTVPC